MASSECEAFSTSPYSYGLYSWGLYSYGLYSYGHGLVGVRGDLDEPGTKRLQSRPPPPGITSDGGERPNHRCCARYHTGPTYIGHNYLGRILRTVRHGCVEPSPRTGNNYIGRNYIGHNYISHNYIGHNYTGHTYTGHNCMGHKYIGP